MPCIVRIHPEPIDWAKIFAKGCIFTGHSKCGELTKLNLRFCKFLLTLIAGTCTAADDVSGVSVQQRMSWDVQAGKPLVAHVVVALCDNKYQGIVPVPAELGDGDNPSSNLYWGALFGVKTFLSRHADWSHLNIGTSDNPSILDQVAFYTTLERNGSRPTFTCCRSVARSRYP